MYEILEICKNNWLRNDLKNVAFKQQRKQSCKSRYNTRFAANTDAIYGNSVCGCSNLHSLTKLFVKKNSQILTVVDKNLLS